MGGDAFDEDRGGPELQHTDDHHRADQPAQVGDPSHDVVAVHVEAATEIDSGLGREPGVRMHDALRQAGRARGVDDAERVVRLGRRGLGDRRFRVELVPPVIAAAGHRGVTTGAAHDHDGPHAGGAGERLVSGLLEFDPTPAPGGRVRGDQCDRPGLAQAGGERVGPVPGERWHRDRTQHRDREERHGRLRHHREEQHDPVPPPDAELHQVRREPSHLIVQLGVGQDTPAPLITLVDHRRFARDRAPRVPVGAQLGHVDHATGEPAWERRARTGVEHPLVGFGEGDTEIVERRRPEHLRVGDRGAVELVEVGMSPAAARGAQPAAAHTGVSRNPGSPHAGRPEGRVARAGTPPGAGAGGTRILWPPSDRCLRGRPRWVRWVNAPWPRDPR